MHAIPLKAFAKSRANSSPSTQRTSIASQTAGSCALPSIVQAKLRIGPTNDVYEREADHVAEQVMRMPHPTVQRKCSCGGAAGPDGECAECRRKRLGLQRKSATPSSGTTASGISNVQDVVRTPGRPLDSATRAFFEPRLGHDLSAVRVHHDSVAAQSARSINALAYTTGSHVAFSAGQYQPSSPSGRRLLAHELTHVIQQTGSPSLATNVRRQPADASPPAAAANECAGWEKDHESFSIHVANHVLKNFIDPSLHVAPPPGGQSVTCPHERRCDVTISNGQVMRVGWEPRTRIALARVDDSNGESTRFLFNYSCPGGQLVLDFREKRVGDVITGPTQPASPKNTPSPSSGAPAQRPWYRRLWDRLKGGP